jgi:hypothetical protein
MTPARALIYARSHRSRFLEDLMEFVRFPSVSAQPKHVFRRHIARITPPTVKSIVRTNQLAKPAMIDRRHPALFAAAVAYRKAFGTNPVFLRSGGSIPVVSTFQRVLSIPTVLMGFALPDDRIHAPNEKFHLPNFYKGIETSIWFLWEVSRKANGQEHSPARYTGTVEPIQMDQR